MTFKYNICMKEEVDIDDLIEKINKADFVNFCTNYFTMGEYALVNFILVEGLLDIRAQEPNIDPPTVDGGGLLPIPDYGMTPPMLDPENNPEDEDPFAGVQPE